MTQVVRRSDGFLERGSEMTRLETFVDAAFAFAVTLLVVGGGDNVPNTPEEFVLAMKQIPAFAASFATIMSFWYAHYRWSRRYGLEDLRSTLLSLLLVFVVLIFVYPLKAVFSGAMHFFTNGFLVSDFVMRNDADLRRIFVTFSAGFAALSIIMALLDAHALSRSEELKLSALERFDTITNMWSLGVNVFVSMLSIILAISLSYPGLIAAGMIYGSFGILMPVLSVYRARRREALE